MYLCQRDASVSPGRLSVGTFTDAGMDAAGFTARSKSSMTLVFMRCVDRPGELAYKQDTYWLIGVIDGPKELAYPGPALYDLVVRWLQKRDPGRAAAGLSLDLCNCMHNDA
jgi:hypothetical protein